MTVRKVLGYGLIAFGVVNILNFYSPVPIPTVGLSAFIVGGLSIAAGVWAMGANGRLMSRVRELLSSSKPSKPRRAIDPILPVRVLKLAEAKSGLLTVSAVAMSLEVGLDDAQAALDELVAKGAASADFDIPTGITTYRFPEFLR